MALTAPDARAIALATLRGRYPYSGSGSDPRTLEDLVKKALREYMQGLIVAYRRDQALATLDSINMQDIIP